MELIKREIYFRKKFVSANFAKSVNSANQFKTFHIII